MALKIKGKYPVGVTLPNGQMAAWRDAMGDPARVPATVPIMAELVVGNCTVRFYNAELPAKLKLDELTRKVYKPRSHWHRKPVVGAAATSRPWIVFPVAPIGNCPTCGVLCHRSPSDGPCAACVQCDGVLVAA